jgi:hypothetical protein
MQVLFLHADDSPRSGPWIGRHWDAVFDLARSGWAACERWSRDFGCPVKPIDGLRDGYAEIGRVRELLQLGLGRLVDKEELDWWELTALLVHQQLERLVLLRRLANDVPPDGEAWITRDGFEADALRLSLGARLHVIRSPEASSRKGPRHYLNRLWRLPNAQVVQVLGDKYDAGYRVRRYFHRRARGGDRPVVLLPSSYINMSLTGAAYARLLPDTGFLLVPTRHSGRLREVPENVRQEWLASYASDSGAVEYGEILQRWAVLKKEIEAVPELAALARLGLMDDFPQWFAKGLAIRNAWLRVLQIEPVEAVLCSDDSNPHTHIPLLLAQRRGLPTVACHHGALDGRQMIKKNHADVILAKGKMEQDYLVHTCGLDPSVVEIGAPSKPEYLGNTRAEAGDWIIFFSEPYEASAGRAEEIYRDIVPGLVDLATRTRKRLVVKLHPSENLADRQSLMQRVVRREQMSAIQWFSGRFGSELLRRAWFGLTVLSSVAMECMVHGVPCFFCDWLDLWPYGYIAQYRKFGVGIGLRSPAEIANIPEMLSASRPSRTIADDCWEAIAPQRLREILAGRKADDAIPVPMRPAQ